MLTGKSFVVAGASRIGLRISRALVRQHAKVLCVRLPEDDVRLAAQLPNEVEVLDAADHDLVDVFRRANAATLSCLIAVADDDLDNVRCCVAAREVAPDLPVVLRAFDPALADQLEHGLNVRRAYSVSALSAPAFVAATFGVTVRETLRLGDGDVLVCSMEIAPDSPLLGLSASEIKRKLGCVVLARNGVRFGADAENAEDGVIKLGDTVVLGGAFAGIWEAGLKVRAADLARKKLGKSRRPKRDHPLASTYLPAVAWSLGLVLLVSVAVFMVFLHLSLVDSIYFVITTATTTGYGDISLAGAPGWLKLYGNLVMISGGALLGVLFSYMAARATAERLGELMGRRAERMAGHVVVVGLGNVGYRVSNQFLEYGVPVVVVEAKSDARFDEALRRRTPVIFGDARLSENLQRASVDTAAAFEACTNDDMANIQACLHAKQMNPGIRTIARIFDDALADRLTLAFQIDCALSPSRIATGAFLGAASGDQAMRSVQIGNTELGCCRITISKKLSKEEVSRWAAEGLAVLAYRKKDESPSIVRVLPDIFEPGDELIVFGPEPLIRKHVDG